MPTGTALSVLRRMVNAECGEEMDETISPALVSVWNQLLNNQQIFLDNQHGYLRGKVRVQLSAVVGQQYYDLPSGVDYDRLEKPVFTNITVFRYPMGFGIGQEEYNVFNSTLGITGSPCMRWDLVNVSGSFKIELWPIPAIPQTIEIAGLLPLVQMTADTDVCVIDDMALVLFTAVTYLARKGAGDTRAVAAKAKSYLDSLKGSYPIKDEVWNISGRRYWPNGFYFPNRRPVVAVESGGGGISMSGSGVGV